MFRKGDEVVAREEISTGVFSSVRAGTRGIVTEDEGIISGPTVVFEGNDGEHTVSANKLMKR